MKNGDKVEVTTTSQTDRIDASVSDERGTLYRTARGDAWYDARYLRPA